MKKSGQVLILLIMFCILGLYFFWFQRSLDASTTKNIGLKEESMVILEPSTTLTQVSDGLSMIRYDESYGFQEFLNLGGASSEADILDFLMTQNMIDATGLSFSSALFGCSTLQTMNNEHEVLFGRNFDWQQSEALITMSYPKDAYASIATVNLDFIQQGTSIPLRLMSDDVLAKVAMYAPLDGMNEKGLAVSVNMIQDNETIQQEGQAQNLTTTTAIRLLLNQAKDVDEAIALLKEYNMHSSMDMMIHFAIVDAKGNHVVVEYINNEMQVIETPVVTNFYLTPGEKYGIGSTQSKERYDILMDQLEKQATFEMKDVKDAMDRVSKDNFDEFESTEWSIVYNLTTSEVQYYHRENYEKQYRFQLNT